MSIRYYTFGIVVDDIVFPDGTSKMRQLGGGGPQSAFGMRLWLSGSDQVGIVAGVGQDLDEEMFEWFHSAEIDTQGFHKDHSQTPRAWQILEEDGQRKQLWRVKADVLRAQLRREMELIPLSYRKSRGVHLGIHPNDPDFNLIRDLQKTAEIVSLEPFKPADSPIPADLVDELLSSVDIFSPNLHEAESLVGEGEPLVLIKRFMERGTRMLALRLGKDGAIVVEKGLQTAYHIPAVPVSVVDPLGAGNAFCGGFLSGYGETGDLVQAGLRGAVSASFLLEQVGLPMITESMILQAGERLHQIRGMVSRLDY